MGRSEGYLYILTTLFVIFTTAQTNQFDCSHLEYDRCVKIADPLVKEAHLIFPDNLDDIDLVCRTWNKFVDCLKRYTDQCFTVEQRRKFNKAVENPIESVHKMCMQPDYQQEYLQYAPCIKSTVTDRNHCGPHYSLLVEQVAQGDIISKATLCCSHDRFKKCVQKETRRQCDRGVENGPAVQFSSQIIDKALSYLQDQCYDYIPNSGDCTALNTDLYPDSILATSPSDIYPWSSTVQAFQGKEEAPSRSSSASPSQIPSDSPGAVKTTTTWLPSASLSTVDSSTSDSESTQQMLGSRTRPASYGRSNSWLDTSRNVAPNNNAPAPPRGQPDNYPPQPTTPGPRPEWATATSWHNVNAADNNRVSVTSTSNGDSQFNKHTTQTSADTWYPAAGNQLSNEVDEPNQQGWSRNVKENGVSRTATSLPLLVVAVMITKVTMFT